MPTRHFGSLPKNSNIRLRVNFLHSTTLPVASMPWTWKTDLAISSPIVVTCFIVALLTAHPQTILQEGWRAVHIIKSGHRPDHPRRAPPKAAPAGVRSRPQTRKLDARRQLAERPDARRRSS